MGPSAPAALAMRSGLLGPSSASSAKVRMHAIASTRSAQAHMLLRSSSTCSAPAEARGAAPRARAGFCGKRPLLSAIFSDRVPHETKSGLDVVDTELTSRRF